MAVLPGDPFRGAGLVVAAVGFAVTRFFVAETVRVDMASGFVLAGLVPLLAGLGLTVYGVALSVGPFPRWYAGTVARWCLLGTGAMAVVLATTLGEAMAFGEGMGALGGSQLLVGNVLLGGAVGGTLTGVRSAMSRRQRREVDRQANRGFLLDRLLRHEVINAATIVRGHADLLRGGDGSRDASVDAIEDAADRITRTVEEVGDIVDDRGTLAAVDPAEPLAAAVDDVRAAFDGVTVETSVDADRPAVTADGRLSILVRELLENAAAYGASRVRLETDVAPRTLTLRVRDDGDGLPEPQRRLLVDGDFPEYDDPSAGFGLQVVRLLASRYRGSVAVSEGLDGTGTTVAVELPRAGYGEEMSTAVAVALPNLLRASLAGLVAGVAMGAAFVGVTDQLPVIGALYGVGSPVIGAVTHLFHSVVFALLFAAFVSGPQLEAATPGARRAITRGAAWGVVLWLVAAGLVMPVWLELVGIPATLPSLRPLGLGSHLLWGVVLGGTYSALGAMELDWLAGAVPTPE